MDHSNGTRGERADPERPGRAASPGQECRVQDLVEEEFLDRTCKCMAERHPRIDESFAGEVWERLNGRWCQRCRSAGARCRSFCFNGVEGIEAARRYTVVTVRNVRRDLLKAKLQREWIPDSPQDDPDERGDSEKKVALVRSALESMAKTKNGWLADLLQLIYLDGLTNAAAAESLGRSLRTVERNRPKAEAMLRRILKGNEK